MIDALTLATPFEEEAGIAHGQAIGMAAAIRNAHRDDYATKADLYEFEARLTGKIDALRSRLLGRLDSQRSELRKEISDSARTMVMWFAGMMFVQAGFIVAILRMLA